MLNEYFYAGLLIVDDDVYAQAFGPIIHQSRLRFEEQKAKMMSDWPDQVDVVAAAFEKTAEINKPIFVEQLGWRLAREAEAREQAANRKLSDLKEQIRTLEAQRDANWKRKERARQLQEAAEARNALDPKHVRKRARQAKERKRKTSR
jgi:hypothetical protein